MAFTLSYHSFIKMCRALFFVTGTTALIVGFSCLLMLRAEAKPQQKPQALFNQANQQLQQGNVRRALGDYKKMADGPYVSGALFLNMGLSYVRLDSLGRAKYYFLKARQFEETRKRARQGLTYVDNHFSHQSAVLPVLPWQRAMNWLGDQVGTTLLLALGLVLLNLGVFGYTGLWFTNQRWIKSGWAAISTACIGILLLALTAFLHYRQKRYHQAVMVYAKTTVRKKPQANATLVSPAYEGYTFRADLYKKDSQNQETWTYVRMSNGQYGWIPTNKIMIL